MSHDENFLRLAWPVVVPVFIVDAQVQKSIIIALCITLSAAVILAKLFQLLCYLRPR